MLKLATAFLGHYQVECKIIGRHSIEIKIGLNPPPLPPQPRTFRSLLGKEGG